MLFPPAAWARSRVSESTCASKTCPAPRLAGGMSQHRGGIGLFRESHCQPSWPRHCCQEQPVTHYRHWHRRAESPTLLLSAPVTLLILPFPAPAPSCLLSELPGGAQLPASAASPASTLATAEGGRWLFQPPLRETPWWRKAGKLWLFFRKPGASSARGPRRLRARVS